MKVLLLVLSHLSSDCIFDPAAANPANHRGAPVSFAYVCRHSPRIAEASILRQLEGEFMKAAAEKGSQGYMSYYADDSVEVPNGGPLHYRARSKLLRAWDFWTTKIIAEMDPGRAETSLRRAILATPMATTSSIRKTKMVRQHRIRQVHQHLEIAERWKLEGRPRHGERQPGAEDRRVATDRTARIATVKFSASSLTNGPQQRCGARLCEITPHAALLTGKLGKIVTAKALRCSWVHG